MQEMCGLGEFFGGRENCFFVRRVPKTFGFLSELFLKISAGICVILHDFFGKSS